MPTCSLHCTTDKSLTNVYNVTTALLSRQPDINMNAQLFKMFRCFVTSYVAIVTTAAVQGNHPDGLSAGRKLTSHNGGC
jgi:hypothetical protein